MMISNSKEDDNSCRSWSMLLLLLSLSLHMQSANATSVT